MSANEAMIVRNADVQALVGSKYYQPRKNGIQFAVDSKGELLPIPKEDIYGLIGTLDNFNQAWGWWVGDTGNAIEKLYGEDELAKFFQKIHFDPAQGKKWMSVSRSFGWPDKISEQRHSDPLVSHRHHQLVQGFKDLKQRMDLLNTASRKKMLSADFYVLVQQRKAGPGAVIGDGADTSEYSVFHARFRAYEPKTDNPEQYFQEFVNDAREKQFPAYLDPSIGEALKARQKREKAVEGIDEPRRAELLAAGETQADAEFKAAVKAEKDKSNVGERIQTYADKSITDKVFADETEREAQIASLVVQATAEGDDLAAFKSRVTNFKKAQKTRGGELKTVEKMATKITDETVRQSLIDRVHAENLTVEQFEPLIKQALTDQYVQEDADRIKKENEDRLIKGADPSKAVERVEKMFAKKGSKPKADVGAPGLTKGAGKKKGAAKRGKK